MKDFASAASDRIDRRSYEPAYAQLAAILRRRIASGVFRPGEQLPSEGQLCAQYGVSPMTVRRVINLLAECGLVTAFQGKGTFVKRLDLGEATFRLDELTDQLAVGRDTTVRLIEARIVAAGETVARNLRVPEGERVVYIRRLILQEGLPAMYHREHLIYNPRRPIVEDELRITSLEGLFSAEAGEGLRSGDLTIESVVLGDDEAGLLQVPVGSPALCLEHFFYDFDIRPISWGWFICRADRFRLKTRIGADVGWREQA